MSGNRPARERFEFSLDARQVAAVILGSLGALGLAFFLGSILAGRVAERPAAAARPVAPAPAPPASLDALDKPLLPEAADAKHEDSFHDRLTQRATPTDKLPPVPKAQAAAAPAASAAAPPARPAAAPQPAQAPAGAPVATDAPRGPPPASAPTGAVAAPAAGPSGPTGGTGAPAPAPVAAPAAAPGPAAPPAKAAPAAPAAPVKVAPAVKPAGKGAWTLQVHSTQDRFDADRVAARLAARGARVVTADVPGKGRWYRVRIGTYETRDAADRALKDLERSGAARGFVTPAG